MNITPKGTAIFVHLTETEVIDGVDTGKFGVSLLLEPKEYPDHAEFLTALTAQQAEAKAEASKEHGPKTDKYDLPQFIRTFSTKNQETGELTPTEKVYVTFRSKYAPKVYNLDGELIGVGEIRGGDKIKLEYSAVPFAMASTKKIGATLYINNIQLVERGSSSSSFARSSGSSFGAAQSAPKTSAIAKLMGESK